MRMEDDAHMYREHVPKGSTVRVAISSLGPGSIQSIRYGRECGAVPDLQLSLGLLCAELGLSRTMGTMGG